LKKEDKLTVKDCYRILESYRAPKIVIKHSEGTAKVAYFIGKKLKEKGEDIDLKAMVYASLLHDTFKIIEIKDYSTHLTKKELEEKKRYWENLKKRLKGFDHTSAFPVDFGKKYPKITNLVVKHRFYQVNTGFDSWEEKIVYYADKLVKFDKITTLKARLKDLKKRYAHRLYDKTRLEHARKTDKKIQLLEKEIFKTSGLSPDDLIKLNKISFKKLIKKDFKVK